MKKILLVSILALTFIFNSNAEEKEEPSVSITFTVPYNFIYDKHFVTKVDSLTNLLKIQTSMYSNKDVALHILDSIYNKSLLQIETLKKDGNISNEQYNTIKSNLARTKEKEYLENYIKWIDFNKDNDLSKHLVSEFSFVLPLKIKLDYQAYIKNIHIKCEPNKIAKLNENFLKVAQNNKTQFVFNISNFALIHNDTLEYAKADIQLYDSLTNKILIDTSYFSYSNIYKEEESQLKTLECHVLDSAYSLIINTMLKYGLETRKEVDLYQKRFEYIKKNFTGKYNQKSINKILDQYRLQNNYDTTIKIEIFDNVIFNDSLTKFIGFCYVENEYNNFGVNGYKNPSNYFTVCGEKYLAKWYLQKAENPYKLSDIFGSELDSINTKIQLIFVHISIDYFKHGSFELNDNFWNEGKYLSIREIFNRNTNIHRSVREKYSNYLDLTQIVADELILEKENKELELKESIEDNIEKYYIDKENSISITIDKIKMYNQRNNKSSFEYFPQSIYRSIQSNLENRLIYDKKFENIILPYFTFISDSIILINSYYYDLLKNKYYKYNLNNNKQIVVNNHDVIAMLSEYFYPYNYGYWSEKYIDDIDFWENIVKAKENGKFKYLEEIDIDK